MKKFAIGILIGVLTNLLSTILIIGLFTLIGYDNDLLAGQFIGIATMGALSFFLLRQRKPRRYLEGEIKGISNETALKLAKNIKALDKSKHDLKSKNLPQIYTGPLKQ